MVENNEVEEETDEEAIEITSERDDESEQDVYNIPWESHFEDPIFAQGWRNYLEYEINKDVDNPENYLTLEEYGVENALRETNVFVGFRRENLNTGDVLPKDYKEKIKSIKGYSTFGNISGIDLSNMKHIPQEHFLSEFKKIDTRGIEKLDVSNTQIDHFDWLEVYYLEEVKMAYTDMDNEDLAYIFDKISWYNGDFDISYTNITRIPPLDSEPHLNIVKLEGLENFETESLKHLKRAGL